MEQKRLPLLAPKPLHSVDRPDAILSLRGFQHQEYFIAHLEIFLQVEFCARTFRHDLAASLITHKNILEKKGFHRQSQSVANKKT